MARWPARWTEEMELEVVRLRDEEHLLWKDIGKFYKMSGNRARAVYDKRKRIIQAQKDYEQWRAREEAKADSGNLTGGRE